MQPAQPTPLAELVKSLAGLQQAQHQALMDMKLEQEDRFRLLVQAQDEDRRAIRSLLGREETPVACPIDSPRPADEDGTPRRPSWTFLKKQRRRVAGRAASGRCA